MNDREVVVNLKSIRMTVTKKEYKLLMQADSRAYEELGEKITKKMMVLGVGYMIESIDEDF